MPARSTPTADARARHREASALPDRLLDVHEAAELFGVEVSTIYDWAYQRKIPVVKPSGPRGPVRFRLSKMLKLIEQWERPAMRPLSNRLDGRGRDDGGQQS